MAATAMIGQREKEKRGQQCKYCTVIGRDYTLQTTKVEEASGLDLMFMGRTGYGPTDHRGSMVQYVVVGS